MTTLHHTLTHNITYHHHTSSCNAGSVTRKRRHRWQKVTRTHHYAPIASVTHSQGVRIKGDRPLAAFAFSCICVNFPISPGSDREREREVDASHTHPVPAVLKAVYGVSSLATLKRDRRHQGPPHTRAHTEGTDNQTDKGHTQWGTLGHCQMYIQRALVTRRG